MSEKISVVIICKNEAGIIEKVLQSVLPVSDDVVVYDSGSTDGTIDILKQYPVQLHSGPWLGYGKTKHAAVALARHNWILSLDADEAPDEILQQELKALPLTDTKTVYSLRFKNFLGKKWMRHGEWGGDQHIRLFHKDFAHWNDADIHETLVVPPGANVVTLKGYVQHFTVKNLAEYSRKMVHYALLNAEKYHRHGKRSTWLKRYVSPAFTFSKHYFFEMGFLDGWEGFVSARMTAFYTFLKYARLRELEQENG